MQARALRRWAAALALCSMAAACSTSSTKSSPSSGTSTGSGNAASARGVTADTIKIGVSYPDLASLAKTGLLKVDNGPYEPIIKAIVDGINASGGINGRKLDVTSSKSSVLSDSDQLAVCTKFTEDVKVFAVLGGFINTDANLCVVQQHATTLITGVGLNAALLAKARAPWATYGASDERAARALVQLTDQQGRLKGKTIAIYAQVADATAQVDAVSTELKNRGYTVATTAVNDVSATDGLAFTAQEKLLAQRMKDKGVDTVFFIGGTPTVANFDAIHWYPQIFVPQTAYITPAAYTNPFDKFPLIAGTAPSADPNAGFDSAPMKKCRDAYTKETGQVVKTPTEETKDGKSSGFVAMQQVCSELAVFVEAARKAGPNLTPDTWKAALQSLGRIELPAIPVASFAPNKFDAQDSFQLMQHDPKWKPNGPIPEFTPLGAPITLSN